MKKQPAIIGLRNVLYSVDSTSSKLLGNYLDDGILSAINDDTNKTDSIEQIFME